MRSLSILFILFLLLIPVNTTIAEEEFRFIEKPNDVTFQVGTTKNQTIEWKVSDVGRIKSTITFNGMIIVLLSTDVPIKFALYDQLEVGRYNLSITVSIDLNFN